MQEDGATWRDHLEKLVALGRMPPDALEGPPIPETLAYLWSWYLELAPTRSIGFSGINPLGYRDIEAWARLTDRRLKPHEVTALLRIDAVMRKRDDTEE